MKKIILLIPIFLGFMFVSRSFSQPNFTDVEFVVYNSSGSRIYIQLYPSGGIFNGFNITHSIPSRYTLNSQYYTGGNTGINRLGAPGRRIRHIVGLDGYALDSLTDIPGYFPIANANQCSFGQDVTGTNNADGEIGFGMYVLKIFKYVDTNMIPICDSILIDWLDFNYGGYNAGHAADLAILVRGLSSNSDITSIWNQNGPNDERHVFDSSDTPGVIQIWRQFQRFNQTTQQWEGYNVPNITTPPSKGNSTSDDNFLDFPLDGRNLSSPYTIPQHNNPNDLNANLTIESQRHPHVTSFNSIQLKEYTTLKFLEAVPANWTRFIVDPMASFTTSGTSTIDMKPYSELVIEDGAIWYDGCGEILPSSPSCIIIRGQHVIACSYLNRVIDNGGFEILEGGFLNIGENSKITYDGPNSYLKIDSNSSIIFGENSSLEFKNGAYLIAKNCSFSCVDSTKNWTGIILENSGIDSIVNCTFSNAKTAISVKNSAGSYVNRIIKNNTFNIPSGGDHKGIYGENNYRILIQDNTFHMPVATQSGSHFYSGIFLKNAAVSGEPESAGQIEEEGMSTPYSLNVIHNVFNNGSASVILANYTSNLLPYFVRGNTFNSAAMIGLLGMKLSGNIKDNITTNLNTPLGIHLVSSYPSLFNNTILARDVSLHLVGNSYPNLAPYTSNNQFVWSGGKNRLTSQLLDNIQQSAPGHVYTNYGENRFNAIDNGGYHIYGWLDTAISVYNSINNCWYPDGNARIYLRHTNSIPPIPTVTGVTTIDCDHEIVPGGWGIDYLGNGIYDSVMISADNSGQNPSTEDLLYEQGNQYFENSMFLDAISSYKNLIDNYPDYIDLPKTGLNLYSCYEYLDTTSEQSERNTLYGNLQVYAEAIINSEDYKNEEFTDICFDIITMCEANMLNYNAASNNYEFIALYHPDPDIRLNASWNYAEVQALINSGNGGGNKLQVTSYELRVDEKSQIARNELDLKELKELTELKELNRLNELISTDPVMSKMKKSFEKSSVERKDKIEKQIQSESKSRDKIQSDIKKSNELDRSKELKAKRNLFELKNLDNENLEKSRIEDMLISTRSFKNQSDKLESVSIPIEYSLSQNYPNPFNPSTNLEFGISKLGFVTLKVFDLLGKEVMTLVNENKPAGRYTVTFDGSKLSSGIYFYKIEAGDFVQVKRMVLIK